MPSHDGRKEKTMKEKFVLEYVDRFDKMVYTEQIETSSFSSAEAYAHEKMRKMYETANVYIRPHYVY